MGAPADDWSPDELSELAGVRELHVTAQRAGSWVPIWVVVAGDRVFVRTWIRRTTGWYGRAVATGRAWIRLSTGDLEVVVAEVGAAEADVVDAAYRAKYGAGADSMVTGEAAASTLRLSPSESRKR